jgi:hypothetical protein
VIERIEYSEGLEGKLCPFCHSGVEAGDYLWQANDDSQIFVCEECMDKGCRILLWTRLNMTQNQERN